MSDTIFVVKTPDWVISYRVRSLSERRIEAIYPRFRLVGTGSLEIPALKRIACDHLASKTDRGYNLEMTAKQQVRQLLDDMPDDVSIRDIQYRLYLQEKLDQALEDVRQGRVLEQEEVDRRLAKWLDG